MSEQSTGKQLGLKTYGRRDFLKMVGKAGVVVGLAPISTAISSCSPRLSSAPDVLKNTEQSYLTEIKSALEKVGNNSITFEQAKSIIPNLVKLFVSGGSVDKVEDLEKKIFIVRADPKTELEFAKDIPDDDPKRKNFLQYPTCQQLLEDYPNIDLSVWGPYMGYNNYHGAALGMMRGGQVFLFLNTMNMKPGEKTVDGFSSASRKFRFNSLDQKIPDEAAPIDVLLQTTLHELRHLEAGEESQPLEKEFVVAYQRLLQKKDPNGKFVDGIGEKSGFTIAFKVDNHYIESLSGLDEYVVNYLAAKNLLNVGLPIQTWNSRDPLHISNFDKLIKQAGISDQELIVLHRESKIEEFMIKVAIGAKGINFTDKQEVANFALEIFREGFENGDLIWEKAFKQYYPDLSLDFNKTSGSQGDASDKSLSFSCRQYPIDKENSGLIS